MQIFEPARTLVFDRHIKCAHGGDTHRADSILSARRQARVRSRPAPPVGTLCPKRFCTAATPNPRASGAHVPAITPEFGRPRRNPFTPLLTPDSTPPPTNTHQQLAGT